jgi:hypothetical protein
MTIEQRLICTNLGKVNYLPGSWDKRFGNNLHSIAKTEPAKELTEGQNEWMFRLLYKYRKQLPKTYEKFKSNPMCSRKEKRVEFIPLPAQPGLSEHGQLSLPAQV